MGWVRFPAKRAGDVNMDITRSMNTHPFRNFCLQVMEVGDGSRGHIRNAMRHGNAGKVFANPYRIPRFRSYGLGSIGPCSRWGGARALNPGVHIGLIVIADIQHVIIAFEHSGKTTKSDVHGCPITSLRNDPHISLPLCP